MNPWKDAEEILDQVKAWNWTPELFERCKANPLVNPCIFNQIRQTLTPAEYEQFDLEYCSHYRLQDRELTKWLAEERKEAEWKKETLNRLHQMSDEELLKALRHIVTGRSRL